ncbi:four-carbon acid sugar kinase family protein [uncultured Cardiobacterium sp.]|uniref:four-carbon acid sugar kinase family protein n=1 Tax=uncultured Cardiobacterium sp. TaxID=417619 RepID=UPI002614A718|nr:four-carbon acid sugar kinase family protein [uncultured Cardiobacterium sp.]
MSTSLLVVADDLTGANDTSVTFARAGFATVLALSPNTLPEALQAEAEVFAVSTDCRPLPEQAAAATAAVIAAARTIDCLYLKIDSTMRGSVAAQIKGALTAWRAVHSDARAVVCPAYPAMGRTIENGRLLVNGVPVNDTPSGHDAICPVPTADMAALLPGALVMPCQEVHALADAIRQSEAEVVVVDARSDDDLRRIAEAIAVLGHGAIPVGSAGLANAVVATLPTATAQAAPDPLPLNAPALLLVTSIHNASQQQVDAYIGSAAGADAIVFSPHPAQLLAPGSLPALTAQLQALLVSGDGTVIIRANPARIASGAAAEALAKTFAQQLAALGKHSLKKRRFGALVLFGGDGSAALLHALGVTALRVLRPIAEGVPLATVRGGAYDGLVVITKSGGFGAPDLLCRMMADLNPKEAQV